MNKILIRRQWLFRRCQNLVSPKVTSFKFFSKDNDKKNEDFVKDESLRGSGLLHDKTQSIQEESFFHKETQEQLQELKKKVKKKDSNKNKKE